MKLFVQSNACRSGEFCVRCRDKESGRRLREQWSKAFETGSVDFECPAERGGKPWGWTPMSLAATGAAIVKQRAKKLFRRKTEPKPIPYDQWPAEFKAIAMERIDGEVGVGDTAKRKLGETGEKLSGGLSKMGLNCQCEAIRQRWNVEYPYSSIISSISA